MAYLSLYRKYRSQSFGELMGQEHITTVLRNALRMGRVAHAYLFCGPRGCGKTSTARLLARALNCLSSSAPTAEPCGVCSLCERIRNGSSMDVIEMDAASETGIDDVREKIIENAKFAPAEARFKVYIIDEVHDLSAKAFDSLLKTIEEPPAHVVFILATTEAHKVPITVRSRCQRMDFRRGSQQDLTTNLRRVLDAEQVEYEPEALTAVARAAEGSFRDSLSLLEQSLAYTDGRLTAEAVHASVGTVGADALDAVVLTIASDDMHAAFLKAGELVESGKDVKQTLIALQLHLRDLLVAATAQSAEALPEVLPDRFAQLREQAHKFAPMQLLQMLDVLADTERDLRFSNQHRLLLERAFWSILPSALTASRTSTDGYAPGTGTGTSRASSSPIVAKKTASGPQSTPVTPNPIEQQMVEAPAAVQEAPTLAGQPEHRFAAEIDLEAIRRVWPRVIRRLVHASKSAAGIFTSEVLVTRFDGKFVDVGFPKEFERGRADRPKGREALEQALASELGTQGIKVRCVLLDTADRKSLPQRVDMMVPVMDLSVEIPSTVDGPGEEESAAVDDVLRPSSGRATGLERDVPSTSAPDEHNLFVELVMKELDCAEVEE